MRTNDVKRFRPFNNDLQSFLTTSSKPPGFVDWDSTYLCSPLTIGSLDLNYRFLSATRCNGSAEIVFYSPIELIIDGDKNSSYCTSGRPNTSLFEYTQVLVLFSC